MGGGPMGEAVRVKTGQLVHMGLNCLAPNYRITGAVTHLQGLFRGYLLPRRKHQYGLRLEASSLGSIVQRIELALNLLGKVFRLRRDSNP